MNGFMRDFNPVPALGCLFAAGVLAGAATVAAVSFLVWLVG